MIDGFKGVNKRKRLECFVLCVEFMESNKTLREFCREKQINRAKMRYNLEFFEEKIEKGGIDILVGEIKEVLKKFDFEESLKKANQISSPDCENLVREFIGVQVALSEFCNVLYRVSSKYK